MPLPIQFDWSEDEAMLYFVLHVRGIKAKAMQGNISLCDVYVKVNCHPALFEVDLLGEIDPEHPKTRARVGADKVTLNLKKKVPGLWNEFRAKGPKAELRERRRRSLEAAAEREQEMLKKKDDWKQEMLKAGESEQWRLDRENRDQIEKWEQEEKTKWEEELLGGFDEERGDLIGEATSAPLADGDLDEPDEAEGMSAPVKASLQQKEGSEDEDDEEGKPNQKLEPLAGKSSHNTISKKAAPPVRSAAGPQNVVEVTEEEAEQIRAEKSKDAGAIWTEEDLDDTEEYVPDVRDNPGKIGVRFSARPRAGVPVRDRGQRAPPFPKQQVKSEQPPMVAGDEPMDENDPVWLKDKADTLMVNGDYQGALNAYTEALKLALNARAFANRAVAHLYLGNFEQCLEDCNHSLRILDKRQKVPEGQIPGPTDPQDQVVRARVEIRMATAFLWLGAFSKAEQHFEKALEAEEGLDLDERGKVKEDLARAKAAKAALILKEKADSAADRVPRGPGPQETEALEVVLGLYQQTAEADERSAVVYANRSFARLRAGQFGECLNDGSTALELLKQWPGARKAPKPPARPTRLDPPFLDDPTFKHPDEQKQGEVDWLMKHGGGNWKDLPSLPPEYEWVKDVAEKQDNAWIAIRKKMPKVTIDAIRRATTKLQDVLYTRNPRIIREHLEVAIEENKAGEGPSNKAIRQSEEYAEKLEVYEKEKEAEREQEAAEERQELEEYDLDADLSAVRSGVGQTGFAPTHPVERTRRRLYVKVLLRRARAFEAMGDAEASASELRRVLRVEPENPEAKRRLAAVTAAPSAAGATPSAPSTSDGRPTAAAPAPTTAAASPAPAPAAAGRPLTATGSAATGCGGSGGGGGGGSREPPGGREGTSTAGVEGTDAEGQDREEDGGVDHSSTNQLLSAAAEYMRKNDYEGALQLYGYLRNRCKVWDSPQSELKVLSNRSLCLQRVRGRLPELITSCNEALTRMADLSREPDRGGVSEEMLLRMQCACLSRRGNAYMQQRKSEEGNRDLARVRELLARVEELEARDKPPPAG